MNVKRELKKYFDASSAVIKNTGSGKIAEIAKILLDAKKRGATVFTAGNGGSSATASHIVNDLMKGCRAYGRTGFRAICLTDSSTVVTCFGNDFCYEDVFAVELKTLAERGDVLIVFSGSGNSPNIVRAAAYAREAGITVIGFLGRDGGMTLPLCDKYYLAPTDCMEQIEDSHLCAEHALATVLRKTLENEWGAETVVLPERGKIYRAAAVCGDNRGLTDALRKKGLAVFGADDAARIAGEGDAIVFTSDINIVGVAVKRGGYAVGSAGTGRNGEIDMGIRKELIGAGAGIIVPDFGHPKELLKLIFVK
jgi:D-sedoheptulose 7-phosphate isomerase